MATLALDAPRKFYEGIFHDYPMIVDIIYQGAAVGDNGAGYSRPLVAGDPFLGFADDQKDNSAGSIGDKNIRTRKKGVIRLNVSGAVITDVGQPVYASDDDTFVFSPVGNSFIGFISSWVSAGVVIVEYDVNGLNDPYAVYGAPGEYETISGAKTLDIEDNGKVFFVDTTAVITLPVVATPVNCTIVNIGALGGVQASISPAAADMIHAPDIAGTNDKDHINTLATAQRGDLVQLRTGDANGWPVSNQIGTWAQEA